MGVREWGLILILSAIWGGSFFFVGVAVKEMTPLTIVLCRVGLVSMILLAVLRLTGKRLPASPGIWGAFFVMGALNNLIPVSAIFLGVVVLGERPGWNAFGGMALIFMGLMAIDGRLVKRIRGQAR
jgi:drug/metabolite transporter (DMT)-like permease